MLRKRITVEDPNKEQEINNQVTQVYILLTKMIVTFALGIIAQIIINYDKIAIVCSASSMVAVILFVCDKARREIYFYTIAAMMGGMMGPLIHMIVIVDMSILVIASTITALMFAVLTAIAFKSPPGKFLYLEGFLATGLMSLVIIGIMNMFMVNETLMLVNVYFGLMIFTGYVMYDTSLMIERIRNGKTDLMEHALNLFLDVLNIFIRILHIVIQFKNDKSDNRYVKKQY